MMSHSIYVRELQLSTCCIVIKKSIVSFHICARVATLWLLCILRATASLIPYMCAGCNGRNCANFTAPLFNFCCIRSHVCSEMASSPLMGCDFWCEPLGIFMCAYISHPVRICEPWLCLSATSAYKYVLR